MSKTPLTKEGITQLLLENDRAVARALVVLFRRQTETERQTNTTRVYNNVGFTSGDARRGSIHAKIAIRDGFLEDWQLQYWRTRGAKGRPRIAKYWRQLVEAAKERQAA